MLSFSRRPDQGFSLLEILIAVVIVSILAAISLPSYQQSIYAGRRGEAKAELMRLAQAEARWRVNHTTYGNLNNLGGALANSDYSFAVSANTATAFTLTATPTARHGQHHDGCATLSMTQDSNISSSNPAECVRP